jgi:hypothetical protein
MLYLYIISVNNVISKVKILERQNVREITV